MIIKDLEISKELSGKELSAVRGGGVNTAQQNGPIQATFAGVSLFSPNTQIAPQTLSQSNLDFNISTVVASAGVLTGQLS
jgi:hypothetical protein